MIFRDFWKEKKGNFGLWRRKIFFGVETLPPGQLGFYTELYNNWRTCSYTSFSQRSEAKNMADFE
jgi:hypothetical protein